MAILMPQIIKAKQSLRRSLSNGSNNTFMVVPKGYFAVYVGEQEKKRFVVPVSLLRQPAFKNYYVKPRKSLGSTIQWVASPFNAAKTYSLISLLDWGHCNLYMVVFKFLRLFCKELTARTFLSL